MRVITAAVEAGITLIDTADVYCLDQSDYGHNERLVARALRELGSDAQDVIVATKGGLERPGGSWTTNAHPEHVKSACEASLDALDLDCIDLYQLHAPDRDVPWSDSVGALADLQMAGKIRHVGLSNVERRHVEEAETIVPITSVQNRCNVFERLSFETGVISLCEEESLSFLAHSPVGGNRNHWRTPEDPTLKAVAERHDATPYEVALAWLLARSASIVVIPGASRTANVRSSATARTGSGRGARYSTPGSVDPAVHSGGPFARLTSVQHVLRWSEEAPTQRVIRGMSGTETRRLQNPAGAAAN